MRTPLLLTIVTPLMLVAACGPRKAAEPPPPPPPPLSSVLPVLPLPPSGTPLSSESGADATRIVIVSTQPPDSVADYYRRVLGQPPFRLVNETNSGGVISFYANQDGPSIWVTVQANGEAGSQVVIAGARVDTTKKATPDTTKAKAGGD